MSKTWSRSSGDSLGDQLASDTQIRRLALKKELPRPGLSRIMAFPEDPRGRRPGDRQVCRLYRAGRFAPELVYPLLVLRQNIYTDPQKPIQVQPGIYEINNPKPDSPVLVTTNFSITYFSVANEVEGSGLPAWLLVCDAEGMSVLTAWAAGKFDAERIAKAVKSFNVADKITRSAWSSRACGGPLRRAGRRAARLGNPGWPTRSGGLAEVLKRL